MGEWSFLSGLFDALQVHSPMLGRFWLLLMLVFRILILGTVAGDLFEDEQGEFACNTLQPGCKQVCYDDAFPISQYRFWVFHIVLISTPSLIFLMYAMHHHNKRTMQLSQPRFSQLISNPAREERHLRQLYVINVAFRLVTEVGFLIGQWWLYGFRVEAQFPCSRFPCPYTVDCFVSRPMEKTVFLCFYFAVGVITALSSFVELVYASLKWFRPAGEQPEERVCNCQNLRNLFCLAVMPFCCSDFSLASCRRVISLRLNRRMKKAFSSSLSVRGDAEANDDSQLMHCWYYYNNVNCSNNFFPFRLFSLDLHK